LSAVMSISPRPTPNLHLVCPVPFKISGMGHTTRTLRSRQHSSPGHRGSQSTSPRWGGSPVLSSSGTEQGLQACIVDIPPVNSSSVFTWHALSVLYAYGEAKLIKGLCYQ
jgi:hypothetical protein